MLARVGLAAGARPLSRRRCPAACSSAWRSPRRCSGGREILLLDEPFGALDPGIRVDMQELLTEIWSEHGMTVVMVTHDIAEAFKLGTRVLVFDKVRHDPQFPSAYGATITYDLKLDRKSRASPAGRGQSGRAGRDGPAENRRCGDGVARRPRYGKRHPATQRIAAPA